MGRQIRFFLCPTMRTAIETEAHRLGAALVSDHTFEPGPIKFSTSCGIDQQQGRLWTEATDPTHFDLLCQAVKKGSVYDKEFGLWVKRTSLEGFGAYRAEKKTALDDLVARNRKYAIEVLGCRIAEIDG